MMVIPDKDESGRPTHRPAVASKGWTYNATGFEATTSDLDSVHDKDVYGVDRGWVSLKLYDDADAEITTEGNESNCVKTIISFAATEDIELIGGRCFHMVTPTGDCRLWAIAAPLVPVGSGGSKPMINGVNLKYIPAGTQLETDGRASKHMTYDAVYYSHRIDFIIKHAAGLKVEMMYIMDLYRA